ncbi:MAG: hypothetical protein HY560_05855 [Gemmatimonadetes bacterium]|nr:hypothetical protein [Gemmatimonadota bacterium]
MFRTLSLTAGLTLAAASAALAQMPKMAKPAGATKTVTGTVVDVSCKFGQGLTGADHRMCAQVCADKGIPLAILSSDGKLYVPVSDQMPGEAQNARLKEFAEQEVTVTGTVFAAGGGNAIQIASIKRKA